MWRLTFPSTRASSDMVRTVSACRRTISSVGQQVSLGQCDNLRALMKCRNSQRGYAYRRFCSHTAVWRQEAAQGTVGTVGPVALLAVQRLFIQVGCLSVFILLLLTPHQGHRVEARALKLPVGALSRELTLRDTDSSNIHTR